MIARWLIILAALLGIVPLQAGLNENGDFQFWSKEEIRGDIGACFYLKATMEFRIGNNWKTYYYQSALLQGMYTIRPWIDAGLGDQQISVLVPGTKLWRMTTAPFLEIIVHGGPGGWWIEDKNRLVRAFPQGDRDFWIYRNELTVDAAYHWTCLKITPHLKNDWFYRFGRGFNRDELYVGFKTQFSEVVGFTLLYLWQFTKRDDSWITISGIQANFKFVF